MVEKGKPRKIETTSTAKSGQQRELQSESRSEKKSSK